jgi:hypothetical protein
MKKIVALGYMVIIGGIMCPVMAAGNGEKKPSSQPAAGAQAKQATPPGAAQMPVFKPDPTPAEVQSPGMAALAKASAANKYLFVFFSKADDAGTLAMRKVFDEAMAKSAGKADTVAVRIDDPAEKEIVAKYGVAMTPMPLVLAVAPNGAVTKGLPLKFDEKALLDAFASPGMEKSLKALQDRKLVLLCVQNKSTKDAAAAMKGVQEFAADKKLAADTGIVTVVVQIDPADASEAKFLTQLKIDPKTQQAVTAFIAPPGVVLTLTKGATTKEAFMTVLKAALSGKCGPGGCGPGGCP